MSRLDRNHSPVETTGAPAVTEKDVGHGRISSARNNGYVRKSKLQVPTKQATKTARKSNSGQVLAEGDTTEEEAANDSEPQDSDAEEGQNSDDDDADRYAPLGAGSLTRQDTNQSDTTEIHNVQAGLSVLKSNLKRKRTTSELSTASVLSTIEHDEEDIGYPRKRISRRLSNEHGLLKYDARVVEIEDDDIDMEEYSKAIESSSEEEDGPYDAISQVDEEDESDFEKLEEAMIIEEETARLSHVGISRALAHNTFEASFEIPSDGGFIDTTVDASYAMTNPFLFQELDTEPETPLRKKSDASARRVRFQDDLNVAHTYSSSVSSSETDIDIFPDLMDNPFKPQDDLPATLRSQLDNDEEYDVDVANAVSSDGEGSVWDFGEEKASENFFSWHDVAGSGSDDDGSCSELSGYDTDGDTTDDDLPPPSTIRSAKSLLHSRSPSTITSELTTPKPFPRSRRARRGPIMGSFIVDEKKAMAFIDPNTKQLRIQPARQAILDPFSTTSSVNNSPQVHFHSLGYESDNSDMHRMLTGPSDVMMSGVFGGLPGQRYEDGRFVMESNGPLLIGPPEAFYPFTSIRADGTPEDEDEYGTDEEFEDDCDLITAFLDVDDDDEEPDFEDEDITSPTTTDAADATPKVRTASQSLLDHFDRGVVNSFRNNQDRHRHTSKLPHDYNQDSTPIRSGKTADDVMTPLRKRKSGGSFKSKPPRRMPLLGGFS